jgi:hypothetical protein
MSNQIASKKFRKTKRNSLTTTGHSAERSTRCGALTTYTFANNPFANVDVDIVTTEFRFVTDPLPAGAPAR